MWLASYHSERCNPFRPGAESRPSLGEDVCCRISFGWMTLSSAGRAIGMQSTIPIQLRAQNSLSSSLSRPDLATTPHNLLNYSRLEEETDILTSAPLHVNQTLFGPSSCPSPNVIWVDTVFSFCWTNNTFGGSHILLQGKTAAIGGLDVSGMDTARAAMEQPAANKARGRMDGSPIHEPEHCVTSAISWWKDPLILTDRVIRSHPGLFVGSVSLKGRLFVSFCFCFSYTN